MDLSKDIIESMKSHAKGHIDKHLQNVKIYLANPAGIGEHSDVLEAIEKELNIVAEYHDQLEVIEKYLEK